jgi:hypothetical protein
MVYKPIALEKISHLNLINKHPLKFIESDDVTNPGLSIKHIQIESIIYDSKAIYISLGDLADLENNEVCKQFPIADSHVCSLLFHGPMSLIRSGCLFSDIEIGVVCEDISNFDPTKSFAVIISGRKRLVSILTWAKYSNLPNDDYLKAKLRVVLKIFKTQEALQKSIITANGSRRMPAAEKTGITASAYGVSSVKSMDKKFEATQLSLAQGLGQNLHFQQIKSKSFRTSMGHLLTHSALEKLAFLFVRSQKIPKTQWTNQKLTKLTSLLIAGLPKTLETVEISTKESMNGNSYLTRVVDQINKSVMK